MTAAQRPRLRLHGAIFGAFIGIADNMALPLLTRLLLVVIVVLAVAWPSGRHQP